MLMTGHQQVPVERLSGEGVILLMPVDASVVSEEPTCLVLAKCTYDHLTWTCCAEVFLSASPVDHDHDTFPANHHSITFVGRPFPLEEAPQHLARLRRWGLSFSRSDSTSGYTNLIPTPLVRFLVTWEAVEHAGP